VVGRDTGGGGESGFQRLVVEEEGGWCAKGDAPNLGYCVVLRDSIPFRWIIPQAPPKKSQPRSTKLQRIAQDVENACKAAESIFDSRLVRHQRLSYHHAVDED
jgi:hypothetical protein